MGLAVGLARGVQKHSVFLGQGTGKEDGSSARPLGFGQGPSDLGISSRGKCRNRIDMDAHVSVTVSLARRMLQEAEILGCLGGHPNIVQLRVAAVSQQTLRIYLAMHHVTKTAVSFGLLN